MRLGPVGLWGVAGDMGVLVGREDGAVRGMDLDPDDSPVAGLPRLATSGRLDLSSKMKSVEMTCVDQRPNPKIRFMCARMSCCATYAMPFKSCTRRGLMGASNCSTCLAVRYDACIGCSLPG